MTGPNNWSVVVAPIPRGIRRECLSHLFSVRLVRGFFARNQSLALSAQFSFRDMVASGRGVAAGHHHRGWRLVARTDDSATNGSVGFRTAELAATY